MEGGRILDFMSLAWERTQSVCAVAFPDPVTVYKWKLSQLTQGSAASRSAAYQIHVR